MPTRLVDTESPLVNCVRLEGWVPSVAQVCPVGLTLLPAPSNPGPGTHGWVGISPLSRKKREDGYYFSSLLRFEKES